MEEHTNIHTSQLIDVRYHCHCIIFFSSFSKWVMYVVLIVDVLYLWVWRPIYWFADKFLDFEKPIREPRYKLARREHDTKLNLPNQTEEICTIQFL